MNAKTPAPDAPRASPGAQIIAGYLDVLVGFGCALVAKGLITREEIASAMARIADQQIQRDGPASSSAIPAQIVKAFFDAPVFDGKPN
jgi:hypothetical protein